MNKSLCSTLLGFCILVVAVIFSGCGTLDNGATNTAAGGVQPAAPVDTLQIGDRLKINFSGLPIGQEMTPHEEQINESGNISLPLIGSVKAAGKSLSELQTEIHDAYVPRLYKNLNVSVNTERFYFVGGEVKSPGRQAYLSGVTVLQAIQSAGDFTDFADRKHVRLTRVTGKSEIVNCKKALKDRKLDLPVYPSDTITVPRGL